MIFFVLVLLFTHVERLSVSSRRDFLSQYHSQMGPWWPLNVDLPLQPDLIRVDLPLQPPEGGPGEAVLGAQGPGAEGGEADWDPSPGTGVSSRLRSYRPNKS